MPSETSFPQAVVVTILRPPLFLITLFCLFTPALAQDTVTGAFEGTVTDSRSGVPLKDAVVEIINQQTTVTLTLKTDYRGRFYQGLLLPGTYIIRVSMSGYVTKAAVQLLRITYTGEVVPVPVALDPVPPGTPTPPPTTPAPSTDNDIRASMITIDGRRSGSYGEQEVVTLPVGVIATSRSFDEFALLLPGVAPPPQTFGSVAGPGVGSGVGSAGQFSANGLRSRGNNFTVDGSDNNDEDIGVRRQGFVALIPQPIESIQEYQAITLLAPAQFGRNLGAQVNAVSKSGGNRVHGTVYGRFNSSQLNARNFFDTRFGNSSTVLRANNQDVLLQTRNANGVITSQQPLMVLNESGDEDSFTFWQGGLAVGGPINGNNFYFASFESIGTNATTEQSFAVPTIQERGAFGTGTTGIFQDPFTGQATSTLPVTRVGSAIFSLFPFPNNPGGVYGPNTLTHTLPAGGRASIFSGKIDNNFKIRGREQSITGRYNFTNDWRNIPTTSDAIFSTLRSRVRTQNFSLFLNSKISGPDAPRGIFNQLRLSYGRTRLRFDEIRDTRMLLPSNSFSATPFLLNVADFLNVTTPNANGGPNTGQVVYVRQPLTSEQEIGPVGQVVIAGFSPVGVDVYNFPQQRINNTYQVADNLTLRQGNHNFTFGADIRRSELNSDLPRINRTLATFNGSPRLVFENGSFRFPISSDLNQFIRGVDLAAMGAASNSFLTLNTVANDAKISLRYYQLDFFGSDEWRVKPQLSLSLGLRYEYNTPVREINRRIENTFNDPALSLAPGLRTFIGDRTTIYDPDRNNLAPRFGIAYMPNLFRKERTTVIRGGFGIFYDQILGAVVSQSRNVYPTFVTLNFGGLNASVNQTPLSFFNPSRTILPTPSGQFVLLTQPGTINQLNPAVSLSNLFGVINQSFPSALSATLPTQRLEMPRAYHYNVSFEQQLARNMLVSAAYVGTQGRNLLRFTTPNLGPASTIVPSAFNTFPDQFVFPVILGRVRPPTRAVAGIGAVNLFETTAESNFNSLQLQLRGRFKKTLQYQVAYTVANARDDVSDVFDLAGAPALPQNSLTFAGERGPANFDIRQLLSYNFIYDLPDFVKESRFLHLLLGQLQIAGTGRMSTGQPFTVNSIFDVNLDGNLTDRLNSTNGLVITGDRQQPVLLTANPATLLAPVGSDGNISRNAFRAGGLLELNISFRRQFSFGHGNLISAGVELFNLTNRANFGIPVRFLEAPGFGISTATVTPGRRAVLSLKYSF